MEPCGQLRKRYASDGKQGIDGGNQMKTFSMTAHWDGGVKTNQDYMFTSETEVGNLPNLFLVADGYGRSCRRRLRLKIYGVRGCCGIYWSGTAERSL